MSIMDLDPKLLGFIVFVGTVVVLLIVIGAVRAGWRAGRILINLDGVASRNGKNRTRRSCRCQDEAYPTLASGDAA
jgi:hypothetical protein